METLATQAGRRPLMSGAMPTIRPFYRGIIAGISFDFITAEEVVDVLRYWHFSKTTTYVTLVNPHSVIAAHRDPEMLRATELDGLTLPDGVGVILAAFLLGLGRRHRVTGPHLMLTMCDLGRVHGLKHFFYGGRPGVANTLAECMQARFPGIQIVGTLSPPFRELTEAEREEHVKAINQTRPDVVWVGLGAPKQEKWMSQNFGHVQCTAMIGVGAAFDFHSGNVRWAPAWVRRWGLEWAFRLCCEPSRLWRRNMDSPLFLARVVAQLLLGPRSELEPVALVSANEHVCTATDVS